MNTSLTFRPELSELVAMVHSYGSVEEQQLHERASRQPQVPRGHGVRRTRMALTGVSFLVALALVSTLRVSTGRHERTALDDPVEDPLANMKELDSAPHVWKDEHGPKYDPEKQNVLNDDDAFTVPFVGYAKKDLKWRAPAEPQENVLDYLSSVSRPTR